MDTWFLASEYPDTPAHAAAFHIIPVPYEQTVSYGGGTEAGPEAIICASGQLERLLHDGSEPGSLGMHTLPPINCHAYSCASGLFTHVAELIERAWDLSAVPLLLGGEHAITNGSIIALRRRFGPDAVGILQFDAHMDLRDTYQGTVHSHACVMKRAVDEKIHLFQVGVRNYSEEEILVRQKHDISFCDARDIHRMRLSGNGFVEVSLPDDFPEQLFISFDVDGFDASVMPATGTPDPGGFMWWEAVDLLERLTEGRRIIGADIVELAPKEGLHHCDYTAAKLAYFLMGLTARRNRSPHDRTSS